MFVDLTEALSRPQSVSDGYNYPLGASDCPASVASLGQPVGVVERGDGRDGVPVAAVALAAEVAGAERQPGAPPGAVIQQEAVRQARRPSPPQGLAGRALGTAGQTARG